MAIPASAMRRVYQTEPPKGRQMEEFKGTNDGGIFAGENGEAGAAAAIEREEQCGELFLRQDQWSFHRCRRKWRKRWSARRNEPRRRAATTRPA